MVRLEICSFIFRFRAVCKLVLRGARISRRKNMDGATWRGWTTRRGARMIDGWRGNASQSAAKKGNLGWRIGAEADGTNSQVQAERKGPSGCARRRDDYDS